MQTAVAIRPAAGKKDEEFELPGAPRAVNRQLRGLGTRAHARAMLSEDQQPSRSEMTGSEAAMTDPSSDMLPTLERTMGSIDLEPRTEGRGSVHPATDTAHQPPLQPRAQQEPSGAPSAAGQSSQVCPLCVDYRSACNLSAFQYDMDQCQLDS